MLAFCCIFNPRCCLFSGFILSKSMESKLEFESSYMAEVGRELRFFPGKLYVHLYLDNLDSLHKHSTQDTARLWGRDSQRIGSRGNSLSLTPEMIESIQGEHVLPGSIRTPYPVRKVKAVIAASCWAWLHFSMFQHLVTYPSCHFF